MKLTKTAVAILEPRAPFNFDFTVYKPSHFETPLELWEFGKYWQSMNFLGKILGIKLENLETISKPKVKLMIFSKNSLIEQEVNKVVNEIKYRFEFDRDVTEFYSLYKNDKYVGNLIKKWNGTRHKGSYSMYESLMVYIRLQNAPVRRSVQMLSNLLNKYGTKIEFDNKELYAIWKPDRLVEASDEELRSLKVGYRSKFFKRISESFYKKEIDEFKLRTMSKEDAKKELLKLYGIGQQSVWYFLFEELHFYDATEKISPWEAKLYSMALFGKLKTPDYLVKFLRKRYKNYTMLVAHIIQEDLFWRRKNKEHIGWLEKEIRL